MRIIRYTYRILLLTAAIIASALPASSQQPSKRVVTPASSEMLKIDRLWFNNTGNAAGSRLDNIRYYSQFDIGYSYENGDFTRPQTGSSQRNIAFSTEGGGNVGKIYAWGSFSYTNNVIRDARFNASILDPFRSPFIMADYNLSDWNKHLYDLRMNVATQRLGRFVLGLDANYIANTGAKQVDVRPQSEYYKIDIKPGVAFCINEDNTLGLNLSYFNQIEDYYTQNINNQVFQTVAIMRGMGFFREEVHGGGGRNVYTGNSIGGELQYSYTGGLKLLLLGGLTAETETVISEPTKPEKIGSTNVLKYYIKALSSFDDNGGNTHYIKASYTASTMDGIEYVNIQRSTEDNLGTEIVVVDSNVRSNYKNAAVAGSYEIIHRRGDSYSWRAALNALYAKTDNIYYIPKSIQEYSNLTFGLNGAWNLISERKLGILAKVHGSYNKNLDGNMELNVPNPEHIIITGLMYPDFYYHTTDWWGLGASLTFSVPMPGRVSGGMYLQLAYDINKPLKTESTVFDKSYRRQSMQVKFGCMF